MNQHKHFYLHNEGSCRLFVNVLVGLQEPRGGQGEGETQGRHCMTGGFPAGASHWHCMSFTNNQDFVWKGNVLFISF